MHFIFFSVYTSEKDQIVISRILNWTEILLRLTGQIPTLPNSSPLQHPINFIYAFLMSWFLLFTHIGNYFGKSFI